jgi:expansin (peptidoglycan-binding protein)
MNQEHCSGFVPGLLPRTALEPAGPGYYGRTKSLGNPVCGGAVISRLARMATGPSHRKRLSRRRLLGIELGGAVAVAATAVAVAVGISQATSSPACASVMTVTGTGTTTGEATNYLLQTGDGNCSYPAVGAGQLYVALSPGEYGAAAACGSYLEVTGPDGSVKVQVADQCPECAAGHIDLSQQAFSQIAPLSAGLVPVTYHTIVNPPLPAPLSLRVKEGSSQYWLALLPIGSGNPITSVRVSSPSHGWQNLTHASYNYWLAASGMGPGPFTVQLTDSVGHQATLTGVSLTPGVVQSTGTYMYGAGSPVVAAAAAPATTASVAPSPSPARSTTSPAPSQVALVPAAVTHQATPSPKASC